MAPDGSRKPIEDESNSIVSIFTNMLYIPPVCRVAQWGLSDWRHNRPPIVSTAANTGPLSVAPHGFNSAQEASNMAPDGSRELAD